MSTHRNIDRICVVITVLCLLVTLAFMFGERLGIEKIVDEDAEVHSDSQYFTAGDCDPDWDASDAAVITLNGTEASVSGKGAYAYDGGVVISNGGYYVLSGTLTDGSVTVDAYNSSKVWLLLDGVDITCSDDACLRVDQADKVFLTLAAGSDNSLTGGGSYSDTALADGTDGAIYAHDDLTVNGSGSLTVTAAYRHGIVGNDDLVITGGTIRVSAPADGIRANDSLRIREANITVDAGDDGLVADNEDAYLYIESGAIALTAGGDAIHAAGDVTIDGGSVRISAGDDGIHSDTAFLINAGTIEISECYEGIEAVTIEQTGGDITVRAADDGLNANGGSGGFGMGGMGQMGGGFPQNASVQGNTDTQGTSEAGDAQSAEMPAPPDGGMQMQNSDDGDEETWIRISGGSLTVYNADGRDADGLDSNGSIYITGGDVRVSLLGDGSNSALDFASESGGVAEISGGTVIACGGSSMAERFDPSSSQTSFLYTTAQASADGSALTLTDAQGSAVLSWTVPYRFTAALISAPALQVGQTYTLAIGGSSEELTLSETAGSFGDGGSGIMGGMMGNMPGMGELPDVGGAADGQEAAAPDGGSGEPSEGERPERPGGFGGQRPEMGEMPEMPDGERPEPPGGFGGQRPDMGQMPEPPDGERPEPPGGFGGQRPGMGEMPETSDGEQSDSFGGQRPDMGRMPDGEAPAPPEDGTAMQQTDGSSGTQDAGTADTDEAQTAKAVSSRTWLQLAVCALALAAALWIAKRYRRHG